MDTEGSHLLQAFGFKTWAGLKAEPTHKQRVAVCFWTWFFTKHQRNVNVPWIIRILDTLYKHILKETGIKTATKQLYVSVHASVV